MKHLIPIVVILLSGLSFGLISGCGNSEVESAVYQQLHGVYACSSCARWNETYHTMDYAYHPIKSISSSRTKYDNVWRVDIKVDCDQQSHRIREYAFKNGKLKFIREY